MERKRNASGKHSVKGQLGGRAGLTEKRLQFIDEYMKDRNASRASLAIGWKQSEGSKAMQVPAVRDEIDRRTLERTRRVDITTDDIVRELKRIALFDVRKLFGPDGKFKVNPHEMDEEDARGLVNFDIVVLNKDGDYAIKLNPGNKMKALELLGKHLKMYTDNVQHSGGQTVTFTTDFGDGAAPIGDEDE